jgi:hypothetical protein
MKLYNIFTAFAENKLTTNVADDKFNISINNNCVFNDPINNLPKEV